MNIRIAAPIILGALGLAATASAFRIVPTTEVGTLVRIPICDLEDMPDNIAGLSCDYLDLGSINGCNIDLTTLKASPAPPRNASYATLIVSKYGSESDAEPITLTWGTAQVRNAARMRCTVGTGDPSVNHDTVYFASTYMPSGETVLATAVGRNPFPIPRNVFATFGYTTSFPMDFAVQVKEGADWRDVAVKRGTGDQEVVQLRAQVPAFATTRIVVRTPTPASSYWSFSLRQAEMFIEGCDGPDSVCYPE